MSFELPEGQKRHLIRVSIHDLASMLAASEAKIRKVNEDLLHQFIADRAPNYYAVAGFMIRTYKVDEADPGVGAAPIITPVEGDSNETKQ